MFEKTSVTYIM